MSTLFKHKHSKSIKCLYSIKVKTSPHWYYYKQSSVSHKWKHQLFIVNQTEKLNQTKNYSLE